VTFIDAVLAIAKREDLQLCYDDTERSGKHPSICVYRNSMFLGKLRWPRDGAPASVDESVTQALEGVAA
jgi:hypothetical protein